jgi:hypothetical protein
VDGVEASDVTENAQQGRSPSLAACAGTGMVSVPDAPLR